MITIASSRKLIDGLYQKHVAAAEQQQPMHKLWQLFVEHAWFSRQVERSARYVIRKYDFPADIFEDVQQEALLRFAGLLKKDPMLGYRVERGSYGGYLKPLIYHCCLKSLRPFFYLDDAALFPVLKESQHPPVDDVDLLDELLDFRQSMGHVEEPFRSTVRAVCDGVSIASIARAQNRSPRTIYRWLDQGIEQLSAVCNENRAAYRYTSKHDQDTQ